ncbi:FAD-dependent oxidoreductase [Halobacillus salinarum]|uniref:FAD-dependent oxidoreductase n=1 Tax=Halobacillus salinarum TaxID=2932257 RepID=A0ABY4EJP4_9BACI|nr:FAD-dependent oxidoreductase [Halobacillus salinarum]UOQ44293.1 FAD-dependent oxidoreductase [Halobacillus salinarum]
MTAAHLAFTLTNVNSIQSVALVKRHPFRIKDFDSDPGWLGPKYLKNYHQVDCYEKRRTLIKQARHTGSITRELHVKLKRQMRTGKLHIHTTEIDHAAPMKDSVKLVTSNRETIIGDYLLLATGAEADVPGKGWLKPIIDQLNLPCAPCGFPIVNSSLEWKDGLFVAGALAELEVGPVSRNISGLEKQQIGLRKQHRGSRNCQVKYQLLC